VSIYLPVSACLPLPACHPACLSICLSVIVSVLLQQQNYGNGNRQTSFCFATIGNGELELGGNRKSAIESFFETIGNW
jgi:hypothetical protein